MPCLLQSKSDCDINVICNDNIGNAYNAMSIEIANAQYTTQADKVQTCKSKCD